MRNLTFMLVAFMAVIFYSCQGQQNNIGGYTIAATIEGASGMAILNRPDGRDLKALDSVKIEDGKFTLTGKADEVEMVVLQVGEGRNYVQLFLENSAIEITGTMNDLQNAQIKGGDNNRVFTEFLTMNKAFRTAGQGLEEKFRAAEDEATKKMIQEDFASSREAFLDKVHEFVKTNQNTEVSYLIAAQMLRDDLEIEELTALVDNADAKVKESKFYTDFATEVSAIGNAQVGRVAPDFTMNDTQGNPVTLSSLFGKGYLLVDFWAAWCRPCRAENPNVVAAYNQYKDKGFDVLGVSFDQRKEDWLQAIAQDKLPWTQVSDLQYWDNAAGKLYGIKSIPQNVLLDKTGKIIAKNLRGEDLHNKLAELLGE